jgi:dnd system-associated protein 4
MADKQVARDGVTIEESSHEFYKELTEGSDPETVPFRTMKEMFMWAAALGYATGERVPITGKRVLIFRWAQFSSQEDIPIVKAIAIASSNDLSVVSRQDEMLTIVEEFANRGVQELRAAVISGATQPLWALVEALKNNGLNADL